MTSSASPTEVELANFDSIDEGEEQQGCLPSAGGLSGSAAIVEKLMEVSPNSSVLCISARSEIVMSKRHPHTPVPLLKVLHTVQEECWQFYAVCGQGYSANWA